MVFLPALSSPPCGKLPLPLGFLLSPPKNGAPSSKMATNNGLFMVVVVVGGWRMNCDFVSLFWRAGHLVKITG